MLPPLDVHAAALDVCVVGCGPSGLALAAELGALGVNVGLVGAPQYAHSFTVMTHIRTAKPTTSRNIVGTMWPRSR